MKDQATRERFVELRAEGLSYQVIAEKLGVSKQTLCTWAHDLRHELANARAIRRDELLQRYALASERRVESFGKRFQAIMAELESRNLGDVPTRDLLALALKWNQHAREEAQPPNLIGNMGLDEWPQAVKTWPA